MSRPRRRWQLPTLAAAALLVAGATAVPVIAQESPAEPTAQTQQEVEPRQEGYRKIGYFTQWGVYDRNYLVKDIDTSGSAAALTHINYSFGNITEQGECFQANQAGVGDAWADYQRRYTAEQSVSGVADTYDQPLAGNLNQLRQLKEKYPHLRVQISFGGWTWSKYFSNAAATAESRRAHVESCIDMWIRGNMPVMGGEPQGGPGSALGVFDGIDLDWEWPGSEGEVGNVIRPEDRENFTLLLQEWRSQLDAVGEEHGKEYELSAFLPADPEKVDLGYDVPAVFEELSFGTLQGYDYHGAWDPTTNHQSGLFLGDNEPGPLQVSGEIVVDKWLAEGAPADKLVLGVPFYSRGWTGVTGGGDGLHQPAAGPAPGRYEAGIQDYEVIKASAGNFTLHRDEQTGQAWLFDGNTFWTYDDATEMTRKAQYVKERGLSGAMIWSLDGDTPDGELIAALDDELPIGPNPPGEPGDPGDPGDPGEPGDCTVAAWDPATAYVGGATVSYDGHQWRAKWWTQGETPGTTGEWGVWTDLGPC
ncbi:glycosyl hydrolase family 18 protein [Actinoalloteichus hymeniacidonis]|uniref:chitinase n=1 Tax=Actinoalloteichus hymeniacidonis TaxID=340345 RepID=A0AAC9HUI6_9PSEU|nr:glycosyl hydrolase family 18 protein [Actinoalloteichus hymeniacidonis]AOS65589.1 chitinase [Actinoalloteichus hymeniacidonis]MBB5906321.1 chitinase [Actinoalloteichus hymeniacidonis]